LASMGFDARWGVLGAADVGANHQRDRIWIVGKAANTIGNRLQKSTNKQQLESQRRDQLQVKQSRNTSEMDDTYTDSQRWERSAREGGTGTQGQSNRHSSNLCSEVSNTTSIGQQGQGQHEQSIHSTQTSNWKTNYAKSIGTSDQWAIEPNLGRVADGVAARVDRLKAIGNGQVPLCAATAWRILNDF